MTRERGEHAECGKNYEFKSFCLRRQQRVLHEKQMPDWAGLRFPIVQSKTPVKCPGYARRKCVVLELTGTRIHH